MSAALPSPADGHGAPGLPAGGPRLPTRDNGLRAGRNGLRLDGRLDWPNWHWRHGIVAPGPAVVFDMDGVVSDAASRQHYLRGRRRDWDAFFEACDGDPVIEEAARLLQLLDPTLVVVLLTARPARVQPKTLGWLQRNSLRWDLLVMRDVGDHGASRHFKRRSVRELRDAGFDVQLGFEDDWRNVEMLREEGIPCVYFHSGYYE